jgi:hypothetical protein
LPTLNLELIQQSQRESAIGEIFKASAVNNFREIVPIVWTHVYLISLVSLQRSKGLIWHRSHAKIS